MTYIEPTPPGTPEPDIQPPSTPGPDLDPSERLPRLSLLQCTRTPEYSNPFPGEGVPCCRTSGT